MSVCRCIVTAVFLIVLNSAIALAVAPLSLNDVETLLKSKVSNGRIVNLVNERKLNFCLSKETEEKLKKLGANKALISAIDKCVQTGIQIESEPSGAEVFVDRKFRGNTPLHLSSIATGKHELRVDNVKGYKEYVTEIELLPGQALKKRVVLEKLDDYPTIPPPPNEPIEMVAVSVRTEPVSVNIFLDEKYIGESPAEFIASVGNHHLRLVPKLSSKYETVEKEFTVRSKNLNFVFLRLNSKRN